jgi:FkbM family methyltransferase
MDISTVEAPQQRTTLPKENMDRSVATSKAKLVAKALRMVAERGVAFAVRRAIWRLHYQWFERRRRGLRTQDAAATIRFLGNEFELHAASEGVSEELRLFGVHEPSATDAYLEELSPGDHVLDVGSNLGYYLLLAAQRVGMSGQVLGFEPAPGVYEILERNVQRSPYRNVRVSPWAMGAKSGTLEFFESEVPNWGSVFQDSRLQQTRSTTVKARTVDDVVRENPGFHPKALRMDVEGAELMVLEGAKEVLRRYQPCLFIEFHNFALGWDAVRTALLDLRRLGYSSGILIERTWDQPWMSRWMRAKRRWTGSLEQLIARVQSSKDPLIHSTLIMILHATPASN